MRIYYDGGCLYTDFGLLENALAYRIEIFSEDGSVIWDVTLAAKSCTPPVKIIADNHVLQGGRRYTGRISVITVQEESGVVIPNKLSRLHNLKNAVMEAADDNGCLTFDAQLLQTAAGDSYVLSLVKDITNEKSINLTNVKEPKLDAESLTLLVTGASDIFGAKSEIEIKIWVTDDEKIEMDISAALEPLWLFSDLFPSLKNTVYNFIRFKEAHLSLSAVSYEMRLFEDVSVKIKKGINFYGILSFPILLNGGNKLGQTHIWCGGSIEIADGFPRITISNLNRIPDLFIMRMGTEYCFTQGRILISNERSKTKSEQSLSEQTAAIYAQSCLTGEASEFKIDLPVRWTPLEAVQLNGPTYLEPFLKYKNRLFPPEVIKLFHLDTVRVGLVFFAGGGSGTSWQLTACEETGIQSIQLMPNLIRLEHFRFKYSLHCYTGAGEKAWQYFAASLGGEFLINDSLRMAVDINISNSNIWEMRISPYTQKGLLSALASLLGLGRGLLDMLPPFFSVLANFTVDNIVMEANPFNGSVSGFSMELKSTEVWQVIPGILTITSWKLNYNIKKTSDKWLQSAILYGQIESGLSMGVIVQIQGDSLLISLDQKGLQIPSVGTVFEALGLKDVTAAMPVGIKDLGNINIESMDMKVRLSDTPAIVSVSFSMRTADKWDVLPDKKLTLTEIFASLNYNAERQAAVSGKINAKLLVMEKPIWVSISNIGTDSQWRLRSEGVPMIHIPGFAQMADWMAPRASMAFLPESVIPFKDGFDLTALELGINLSALEMERIYFRIQSRSPWNLLPDALAIERAGIICDIKKPFQDNAEYSFEIKGAVQISCLLIQMTAVKKVETDKWRLEGGLARSAEISFESLEKGLHLTSFPLPYEHGFPKKLEIVSAHVIIIPEVPSLQFRINTKYDWKFSLGPLNLEIKTIEFALKAERKQSAAAVDYTLFLDGEFTLCGIDTKLHFETGSEGETDSIFTARLNGAELKQASLPQLTDAISTDTDAKWGNLGLPGSLTMPEFEYLDLYLNLTKEQYVMVGSMKGIGRAAAVASRIPGTQEEAQSWAYLICAALDHNFRFSSIIGELEVIDDILRIEKAGFVISSFKTDSLQTYLDPVEPCAGLLSFEGAIPLAVKPGAMIFGRIMLAGAIFENIGKLGSGEKNKTLVLNFVAQIAKNPLDTSFEVVMEKFCILDILQFDNSRLKYSPNNREQFELDGILSLTLEDSAYSFSNCFTVSRDTARFLAQTTQEIKNPLGVPGLTIENLELKLDYEFANEQRSDTSRDLYLGGTVGFGKKNSTGAYPLCLTGSLLLKQSEFKVFAVQLESPLSVDDLFASIFTSRIWPKAFLNIAFQTGKLYYAKEPVQTGEFTYKRGFHLVTQVSIYDTVFNIAADIEDGIKITGSALLPLDMKFIQLTDAQCSGKGPGIAITVKDNGNSFGITGGLSLFNEKFLSIPQMDYDTGAGEFKGTIAYNGSVEILRGSISFSWNEEKGLRITEWPLSYVTDAIQYAQLLEQASRLNVSECGALTGMVFDKVITSEFKIKPDFRQLGSSKIELNVSYCIKAAGKKLIESKLSPIQVLLAFPDEISFAKLAKAIIDTIANNAVSITEQILSDPDQLVKLIATVGLKSVAKEALGALLCNGIKSSITADIGAAGASGSASSAASSAVAGNVDAACSAAAYASAAAGASGEAFGYAAGFFAAVAAAAAVFGGGSSKEQKEAKKREKEQRQKKEEAEALIKKAGIEIEKMLTLSSHQVQFKPDAGTVCICWKDLSATAAHTKLYYEIAAYCDSKSQEILHKTTNKNSISFGYNRPFKEKIVVEISVKAELVQGKKKYTYAAKPYQAVIYRPQPVKDLTLKQTGCRITASWQQGQQQGYRLQLYKDGGTAVKYSETGVNKQSSVITGTDISDGEVCTVKISALEVKSQLYSEAVEARIQYSHSMAFNLNASYSKERIGMSWNKIDGALKYRVTILDGKGDLLHSSEQTVTDCQLDLLTEELALYCGEQYTVKVEALSSGFNVVWKTEQRILIPNASERIPELLILLVNKNANADAIFRAVYSRFRNITAVALSRYIYDKGILQYPSYEILRGLRFTNYDLETASAAVKEILPDIKIELITAAIMAVYGDLEPDITFAYELKVKGVAAETAALEIKKKYPQILISRMAEILMTVF